MTTTNVRKSPSGQLAELTSSDIENASTLVDGSTVTDALDTLSLRRIHYLDALDGPVGLWNFNGTINATVGPNFAVSGLGTTTQVAFTDMVPGLKAVEIQGAQLLAPITPALNIPGDLSIELLLFLDSSPTNNILLSHGGSGAGAANNKQYELFFPTPNYPRNWAFRWENGAEVLQTFSTPNIALSPSLPPIHNVISLGWRRQSNILTPWLSGRKFSVDSAAQVVPTGGASGFLTLGGDATAANNSGGFLCASLAIYNYARTDAQWIASYNRSLGDFWGRIA